MDNEFFIDYSKLDDWERMIIDKKKNKNMVVTGTPGAGKSLIALHVAKMLHSEGKEYTILVYTKTLKKYFKDGLEALGLSNVYHYHKWEKQEVEYLLIDECQDFTPEEIDEMRKYGKICLFFGDTAQSIMSFPNHETQSVEETAHKLGVIPHPLYFNYRITRPIALLAEKVGNVDDLALQCKRDGEKPNLFQAPSFDAQLDKIIEIIRNRNLTSVGVLLHYNKKSPHSVEYVRDYFKKKKVACEYKLTGENSDNPLDFHTENPKIMTFWSAKGLQFKDVFIPGCDDLDEKYDVRSAVYVAMTRCSERLYLGYEDNLCSYFPSIDDSVFNNDDDELEF